MGRRRQLNDRQLALLQRVAGGDDLVAADNGAKVSANALHHRGLLRIHRSPWRVAITDTGRYYLEHGRYPDQPGALTGTSAEQPARQTPAHEQGALRAAGAERFVGSIEAQEASSATAHHGPDLGQVSGCCGRAR